MKRILVLLTLLPLFSIGQFVFNANFSTLKFGGPGVTITNKVSNGTSAGSVVLYQNVVNIGGQQIDAIIRTNAITGGAIMIFDQSGTGVGYTNNNPAWFSPQFTFPNAGGSALFTFEFILGNSYNNLTNKGTPVILQNVMINSYDIDGNGNSNSNQFSEFGGFTTSEVSTSTTLTKTYNPATNLTRFISTISTNVVNASDPNTRVRVSYQDLSVFQISVGAQGPGVAYFFIDFDAGVPFGTPTVVTNPPTIDLNTNTPGNSNSATFCSSPVAFTVGGTNINAVVSTPTGGTTLERLKVSVTTSELLNGAAEKLQINNATSGGTIALNFANAVSIPNIVLPGITYSVTATVANGESTLIFMKNGSMTMTMAEGERLIDALLYNNTAAVPTPGLRTFDVKAKDGAYESLPYSFNVTVGSVPTVTLQPLSIKLPVGGTGLYTIVSNANSYQWQVDPATGTFTDITNTGVYSGATTNTLTLTNVPYSMNNYQYRVVASSATCQKITNNGLLAVLQLLPVKWTNFTASMQTKGILLKWGTANEVNSKEFVVQHSDDGIHFTNIGVVSGAGTSPNTHSYTFADSKAVKGNNYYRIQQVDNDGKASFSKVVVVYNGEAQTLRVLSNPVFNGQLSVQVNQTTTFSLYNAEGRLLVKEQHSAGTNSINVSQFPKGIYTLLAGNEAKKILIN